MVAVRTTPLSLFLWIQKEYLQIRKQWYLLVGTVGLSVGWLAGFDWLGWPHYFLRWPKSPLNFLDKRKQPQFLPSMTPSKSQKRDESQLGLMGCLGFSVLVAWSLDNSEDTAAEIREIAATARAAEATCAERLGAGFSGCSGRLNRQGEITHILQQMEVLFQLPSWWFGAGGLEVSQWEAPHLPSRTGGSNPQPNHQTTKIIGPMWVCQQ